MMSREYKLILFVFFLCRLMDSCPVVFAQQEGEVDAIANRPQVEYKSGGLRDPFQTYIIGEKKVNAPAQSAADLAQLETKFNELKVQGIIWGTKMSQAIINNEVYTVGDKIEGAEILSIDNKGVNLSSAAGTVKLAAPGQANILNKENRGVK